MPFFKDLNKSDVEVRPERNGDVYIRAKRGSTEIVLLFNRAGADRLAGAISKKPGCEICSPDEADQNK